MIERRFVFRGRANQRDFYRVAWNKLVIRARVLGDVPVRLCGVHGDKYDATFTARYVATDLPTSEVELELRWPGDAPRTAIVSPTEFRSLALPLGDNCEVVRTFRPKISCPMWSRLRFVFIKPSPTYFHSKAL